MRLRAILGMLVKKLQHNANTNSTIINITGKIAFKKLMIFLHIDERTVYSVS